MAKKKAVAKKPATKCFTNPRTGVKMRRKSRGRGFTTKGCI